MLRESKKWRNATFLSFTGFASRIRSRAAKPEKYENLRVFLRSDAPVVRAGWNIRGCGPLSTPGFFDRLSGLSRIRPARLPGRTPQQILLINMNFGRQSAPRKIPRRAILSIDALGLRGPQGPCGARLSLQGRLTAPQAPAALGKFSKSGTFHLFAGPPPFAVLRLFTALR